MLITGHRRENLGDGLIEICKAIVLLAKKFTNLNFVFPVHLNPVIQRTVQMYLSGIENIHLIPPQDYGHFIILLKNCYLVLTDSGGIQEEAPSLGKPVLIMRDVTERPEAIEAGTAKLIGVNVQSIVRNVSSLMENNNEYLKMAKAHNPFGDGLASKRIVSALREMSW